MPRVKGKLMEGTSEKLGKVMGLVADGMTITRACRTAKILKRTLYKCVAKDKLVKEALDAAVEHGCDALADECIEIADNGKLDPKDRRVRIDTRIRLMGKWSRRYNDKLLLEHSVSTGLADLLRQRRERANAGRE